MNLERQMKKLITQRKELQMAIEWNDEQVEKHKKVVIESQEELEEISEVLRILKEKK